MKELHPKSPIHEADDMVTTRINELIKFLETLFHVHLEMENRGCEDKVQEEWFMNYREVILGAIRDVENDLDIALWCLCQDSYNKTKVEGK